MAMTRQRPPIFLKRHCKLYRVRKSLFKFYRPLFGNKTELSRFSQSGSHCYLSDRNVLKDLGIFPVTHTV